MVRIRIKEEILMGILEVLIANGFDTEKMTAAELVETYYNIKIGGNLDEQSSDERKVN